MFALSHSFNFFFNYFFLRGLLHTWGRAALGSGCSSRDPDTPEKGRTGRAGLLTGSLCGHHASVAPSRALPLPSETSTWHQLGSERWLPLPPLPAPAPGSSYFSPLLRDLLDSRQPQRLCPFVPIGRCWDETGGRKHGTGGGGLCQLAYPPLPPSPQGGRDQTGETSLRPTRLRKGVRVLGNAGEVRERFQEGPPPGSQWGRGLGWGRMSSQAVEGDPMQWKCPPSLRRGRQLPGTARGLEPGPRLPFRCSLAF